MLTVHLTFAGTCEEAFRLYDSVLGGTGLVILHYGDSPAAADVPAEFRGKVVHATLTLNQHQLAGADVEPGKYERPAGFCVLFSAATRGDAARIFARFADGGDVKLPLQATFWSPCFGVVVDRFGTPWEITVAGT
jgi:PhnB protein